MAKNPIIFSLANPVPEISPEDAFSVRDDIIMATGRSDYPNQINNVLGFPYIFRGAMDVRASCINDEMKLAASKALAELAKLPVPEEVNVAFHTKNLKFGKEYIIPKPTDPRLIEHVAAAIAAAAMESGVARKPIEDWNKYRFELGKRMGISNPLIRQIKVAAKREPKKVVFAEAENYKILKAAEIIYNEKLAIPLLLGNKEIIEDLIELNDLELKGIEIMDPKSKEVKDLRFQFANLYWKKRHRKGVTLSSAKDVMLHRNYFGPMLVETNYADAMISGLFGHYSDTLKPAIEIIGMKPNAKIVSGMYVINTKEGPLFLSDCTVNKNPTAEQMVEITIQTAFAIEQFKIKPRIAFASYSNFGSNEGRIPSIQREAISILHRDYPDLVVDGEMMVNVALNEEIIQESFPFSRLAGGKANTLIFPYLTAGNIAYKLIQSMSNNEVIGPVINGLNKSVHVLQLGSSVSEIVNMVMIAVMDAQCAERRARGDDGC